MPRRVKTRDPEIFMIGKTYVFRGTIGGERIDDKKLEALNFAQAKERKEQLKSVLMTQGLQATKTVVGSLLPLYIDSREREFKKGEIRLSTIRETRSIAGKHLAEFFGRYIIVNLDEAAWARYCDETEVGNDIVNHRKVLMHFLRWFKVHKFVRHLPELKVKRVERRERLNLTPDEIKSVFEKLPPNVRLLCGMCLMMGLRGHEAAKASWDRVDFARNRLILRTDDTKTKSKREVPLNPLIREMLLERQAHSKSPYVFPNQRDLKRPMASGSHNQVWRAALAAAGVERGLQPHDLRATFEHYAHSTNAFSDTQLEKMLGASVDVQRKIYVKMSADNFKDLANVVQVDGLADLLTQSVRGKSGENKDGLK